jgi:hypothetical protein
VFGNGRIDCLFFPSCRNLDAAVAIDVAATGNGPNTGAQHEDVSVSDGLPVKAQQKSRFMGDFFAARAHTERRQQIFGKKWN